MERCEKNGPCVLIYIYIAGHDAHIDSPHYKLQSLDTEELGALASPGAGGLQDTSLNEDGAWFVVSVWRVTKLCNLASNYASFSKTV